MIKKIEKNSIAQELGIEPGDKLISINGQVIKDVFDYRYLQKEEYLTVIIEKPNGEEWELEIEKDEDDELGLVFATGLIDAPNSCHNKCIFCFIDQLPGNMRQTLYFKDDDARLGFLQGNYVTLTNMSDEELDRIIFYHLSPVNISVHTTDPELRAFMLNNQQASRLNEQLDKLRNARIQLNFQIVLCKGINDGKKLDESIAALSKYIPQARSLSVVPVGLTKHRDGLIPLEPFTPKDAEQVLQQIERWQRQLLKRHSTMFVFAADEFYLLSGRDIPNRGKYEGFPQLENGVGMMALFADQFGIGVVHHFLGPHRKEKTVITGTAAYPFISGLIYRAKRKFAGLDVRVIPVENKYFGSSITVSGLLTGKDILSALKENDLGSCVLIPRNALRANDTVFLDDMDVDGLSSAIGTPVEPVDIHGKMFLKALLS